ncbi:hypothetical protein [Candidatus Agathobaculum pullicola]|uniref:hypothetical protein n=1 Tax=Candidatus Agathobaculum pullicola TaxID=2838426 RepID=UPI003F9100DA
MSQVAELARCLPDPDAAQSSGTGAALVFGHVTKDIEHDGEVAVQADGLSLDEDDLGFAAGMRTVWRAATVFCCCARRTGSTTMCCSSWKEGKPWPRKVFFRFCSRRQPPRRQSCPCCANARGISQTMFPSCGRACRS